MHESVDRPELTPGSGAVERDDHAGNGTVSEADANEVSRQKIEPVGYEVAEGARGPAHARENGDLHGPDGHRSKCRGFIISFRTISAISFTVWSILPSSFTTT